MSSTAQHVHQSNNKFDYRNPDYTDIILARADFLVRLQNDKELLKNVKLWYRTHPWDFIKDWGQVYEPRNAEVGRQAYIPFVLWPRQIEFVKWVHTRWLAQERGLAEKSRDCGVSWLSIGYAVSMWLSHPGFAVGFGSYKEDKVDEHGNPDSLFEKIRIFIDRLPRLFLPAGFNPREHCTFMRTVNPENESTITGEVGNNIGRGGRKSIQFVDEAAHVENQELVDRSLSATTNCQIDVSSVNGNGNLFYLKRMKWENTNHIFIFDWRHDPRKDEAWHQKMLNERDDVTFAQEYGRDYNASQEDSFIPAKWVTAAIDAHKILGFKASGVRVTGFDPADVGDAKALICRHGSIVLSADIKTQGEIPDAIYWAHEVADQFRADVLAYDGDGMGAPAMKVAMRSMAAGRCKIVSYHGSAGVSDPAGKTRSKFRRSGAGGLAEADTKTNADTYLNYRAQTWSSLRSRFEATYYAIETAKKGQVINVDIADLISIDSGCAQLLALQAELSRPKRLHTANGKIKVESKEEMRKRGVKSPNLADACVIAMTVIAPDAAKIEEHKPKFKPQFTPDRGIRL